MLNSFWQNDLPKYEISRQKKNEMLKTSENIGNRKNIKHI